MRELSPERWRQVDRAFEAVLEAPPEARERRLHEVTGDDHDLAREVRALLEYETLGEERLGESALDSMPHLVASALAEEGDSPSGDEAPGSQGPGDMVGPWRILSEIGRGGMGRVFLAERLDPDLPQKAALKVVRRGMDTDDILLRFRQERRILASLEHPGIARVLDGGSTADGRPWLAMEYVPGVSMGARVEAGDLPLEERLRLFVQVCDAVAWAHRNLVIHRDLKPSNVMVTPDGRARLLDFGIAKLLHAEAERSGPTEPLTRVGRRILTPEWASPEQIAGHPLTTASDVYQLGLLLRWLMNEGLAPPPRDLRLVAGRALDEEPGRRYATAAELATDLRRFLEKRPVEARAPSAAYRLTKFVRRNPVPVGAAAAVILLAGAFALAYARGIATQRDVARLEADRARAALDFVTALFEGADPARSGGDTLNVFQLLERGEARLATYLERRPELRAEMEGVLGRLFTELGEFDRADPLLRSAMDAPGGIGVSGDPGVHRLLDLAHLRTRQGRFPEAEDLLARAQALAERDATSDPETLARVMVQRGGNLAYTEGASGTEDLLQRALVLAEGLPEPRPRLVSDARMRLGTHLMLEGRYPEAEALLLLEVEDRRAGAGEGTPALADALNNLGNLYQRSARPEEAESAHLEALEIRRRVLPADHPDLSLSLNNLGTVAAGRGDMDSADAWMSEAIEVLEARVGRENRNVALSVMNLGWIRMRRGRLEEAEALIRESLDLFGRTVGPQSPDAGLALGNLAQVLQDQGRLAEAEAAAREALRVREAAHGPESMHAAWRSWHLASILQLQGRLEEAEPLYARSLEIRRIHHDETHPEVTRGRNSLGDLWLQLGRWEDAARIFAAAAVRFEEDPGRFAAERDFAWGRVDYARDAAQRAGRPLSPGTVSRPPASPEG